MSAKVVVLLLLIPGLHPLQGVCKTLYDSSQQAATQKKYNLRLTARIHSLGLFSYGGQIANENPGADLNFTYERKAWSAMLLKAADVYDGRSHYNFSLILVYKHFQLGPNLRITPHAGFVLEQRKSFADAGSDGLAIIITSYKLSQKLTLDHCAFFGSVFLEQENFD